MFFKNLYLVKTCVRFCDVNSLERELVLGFLGVGSICMFQVCQRYLFYRFFYLGEFFFGRFLCFLFLINFFLQVCLVYFSFFYVYQWRCLFICLYFVFLLFGIVYRGGSVQRLLILVLNRFRGRFWCYFLLILGLFLNFFEVSCIICEMGVIILVIGSWLKVIEIYLN